MDQFVHEVLMFEQYQEDDFMFESANFFGDTIKKLEADISDWSSRAYKSNSKVVATGDGAWHMTGANRTTIGSANEFRREKQIKWRKEVVDLLKKTQSKYKSGYDFGAHISKALNLNNQYRKIDYKDMYDVLGAQGTYDIEISKIVDKIYLDYTLKYAKKVHRVKVNKPQAVTKRRSDKAFGDDPDALFNALLGW